ncbi:MAG: amidohydrolase family protein [Anaerolineae bacterium]|nr:amidohydrolase family protein [Anaerolineae bacterium]
MLHKPSPLFDRLLAQISELPVIDCHEHASAELFGPAGYARLPSPAEPIAALTNGYVLSDFYTVGATPADGELLQDASVPTTRKWPLFQALWPKLEHTAYGRVTKLVLRDHYGESELTLAALHRIGERLGERAPADHAAIFERARIRLALTDVLNWRPDSMQRYLAGDLNLPSHMRLMFPLRLFHVLRSYEPNAHDFAGVQTIGGWAGRHITSLDEFLEAVFVVLQKAKTRGAVGLKDQAAYNRTLSYDLVSRADAEHLFNRLLTDPRNALGWPEAKPLDDFLFHQYMRFARELNLPVQLHTGHMAGLWNRVDKADAGLLAPVLELHQGVRFDLFHGNWPEMGPLLFLGKNYPNVALDLCWLPIIDPLYAEELLRRAVVAIPHSKVHAFGGDYVDAPEFSVAHLTVARAVIASALADLVERGWLEEEQAVRIAADWLFNNPNEFFKLGLLSDNR